MIKLFTRHPTVANLLMLAFFVLGASSLSNIKRETFPEFSSSYIIANIVYPICAITIALLVSHPLREGQYPYGEIFQGDSTYHGYTTEGKLRHSRPHFRNVLFDHTPVVVPKQASWSLTQRDSSSIARQYWEEVYARSTGFRSISTLPRRVGLPRPVLAM